MNAMFLLVRVLFILLVSTAGNTYDIFEQVYYPGREADLLKVSGDVEIPVVHRSYSRREKETRFTGTYDGSTYTSFEVPANKKPPQLDYSRFLSWETASVRTGKRVATFVNVHGETVAREKYFGVFTKHSRKRRDVFGRDDRLYIPLNKDFGLTEPYIYTVKISTGCTGIAVSPRHVLTAAHCVHDQKDYLETTKEMKVGFPGLDKNTTWYDVQNIKISIGWIEGGIVDGPLYDYSLLKLKKKHDRPYIRLSVSEYQRNGVGERITFNGFDDDKPDNTMWSRSCSVVEDDTDFLYNYCDAKPGSSGSGVYSWVYDEPSDDWQRELVGVFSGNRWRVYDEFYIIAKNFNVAVRLTPSKYAQICKWMGKAGEKLCSYVK